MQHIFNLCKKAELDSALVVIHAAVDLIPFGRILSKRDSMAYSYFKYHELFVYYEKRQYVKARAVYLEIDSFAVSLGPLLYQRFLRWSAISSRIIGFKAESLNMIRRSKRISWDNRLFDEYLKSMDCEKSIIQDMATLSNEEVEVHIASVIEPMSYFSPNSYTNMDLARSGILGLLLGITLLGAIMKIKTVMQQSNRRRRILGRRYLFKNGGRNGGPK